MDNVVGSGHGPGDQPPEGPGAGCNDDRSRPWTVLELIGDHGLVPVVTIDRVDRAEPLGAALLAGGLPCVEITLRTGAAESVIEVLGKAFPEMLVGAGTVITVEQAQAAVAAGSRFIVSPGFDDAVVDWCRAHDVPVVPGVMTPTEIGMARRKGLDTVKFFPADAAGGVGTLHAVGSAYPGVKFIPTGGVGSDNLADYLRLPMVVACGGSWLASRRLIADGEFRQIEELTAAAVNTVRAVRGGR